MINLFTHVLKKFVSWDQFTKTLLSMNDLQLYCKIYALELSKLVQYNKTKTERQLKACKAEAESRKKPQIFENAVKYAQVMGKKIKYPLEL